MHKNGYDFSRFVLPLKFIEKNHNHEITLDKAIEDQIKLEILISKLNYNYNPRSLKKYKGKIKVYNLQNNCLMREKILLVFLKGGLFRIKVMYLK